MNSESKRKWTGIILAAVVLVGIAGLLFMQRVRNRGLNLPSGQGKISCELVWQDQTYTGEYEGDLQKGRPAGEGVFTASDGSLSYEGGWKSGRIFGEGTFRYKDQTWEEGEYEAGMRNGLCRTYTAQNEYTQCLYENDLPYGNTVMYTDGEIVEKTLLINTRPVEELEQGAVELTQKEIGEKSCLDSLVCVKGVVRFVSQKPDECYFRVQTEDGLMAAVRYNNTAEAGLTQCVVPNVENGDAVTIFGYYMGFFKVSDEEDREYNGFSCLTLNPVYACMTEDAGYKNPYSEIKKDPYRFSGLSVEENFTVEKWKRKGKNFYIHARKTSDDDISHVFVLVYTGDATDIFVPGQVIAVEGYYNGQYNNTVVEAKSQTGEEDDADDSNQLQSVKNKLYPRIEVSRIG